MRKDMSVVYYNKKLYILHYLSIWQRKNIKT